MQPTKDQVEAFFEEAEDRLLDDLAALQNDLPRATDHVDTKELQLYGQNVLTLSARIDTLRWLREQINRLEGVGFETLKAAEVNDDIPF